jgi:phosphate transport system substrate-binding protein
MLRNRLTAAGFVAALTMAVVPAGASAAAAKITISGSTSVAPLTAKLIPAYLRGPGKGKAAFTLYQGGSDVGVNDVAKGRVVLGESSRDPKASDPTGLQWTKIARDAICLITNTSNPVSDLSADQVKAIFSGSTTNWSDIPGSKGSGTINLVVRTAASGTQDAFQKLFMGTGIVSSGAAQKASNGLIQQTVQSDPNAIGYVSEAFTSGTNVSKYKSVGCTLKNAKSNAYGGVRNFWYVTRGAPTVATAAYINWVRTDVAAKTIIAAGWVPLS